MRILPFVFIVYIICVGCNSPNNNVTQVPLTKEEVLKNNVQTLKDSIKEGDLLVRLSDELISERVRYLNEKDFSFSHAGVIVNYNNQKMVCNINPDVAGADTIKFEPIDSFINPKKTIVCGLYRYNISTPEKDLFVGELNKFHAANVHFDMVYDLSTDSLLYCTEMIYKALKKINSQKLKISTMPIPKKALPMVSLFFKGKVSKEAIMKRQFVSLDNLYLIPECRQIMKFKLKIFPGE